MMEKRKRQSGREGLKKRFCNIKELSEYTGIPVKTLYDWAAQRYIPSIKVGRKVVFDIRDIDALFMQLKRRPFPVPRLPRARYTENGSGRTDADSGTPEGGAYV